MLTRIKCLAISTFALAALALSGCSNSPDGGVLVQDRCSTCHSLDRVTNASKSRDDWESTVDRMIRRGAVLDSAERETVVDYLAETYP